MRVSRMGKHNFLGTDLDFSNEIEAKFSMMNHLDSLIYIFLEEIESTVGIRAATHLFNVR